MFSSFVLKRCFTNLIENAARYAEVIKVELNSDNENIRDIVNKNKQSKYKSTFDLINGIKGREISDKIIINVHPQRWCNEFSPWLIELIFQNVKNIIKKIINPK